LSSGRPNIVVAGGQPFEEDAWATIAFGGGHAAGHVFRVVKPCVRCSMVNIEQQAHLGSQGGSSKSSKSSSNSAELADPRIFATLAKFRRVRGA
jgi:uncharacterized protein YcbX